MRLLSWNIRHGGGYRVPAIAAWLKRHAADVVVLSEVRATPPSQQLCAALATQGLVHQWATATAPRMNGVLIASRTPLRREAVPRAFGDELQRVAPVTTAGLRIVGLYFPATLATIRPFFQTMLQVAPQWLAEHSLLLGDFNAGHAELDCVVPLSLTRDREFEQMLAHGWVDGWRLHHGTRREYTWVSHAGNGFRIDHALASPSLAARLRAARYDHRVRRNGLSDHSALLLELAD